MKKIFTSALLAIAMFAFAPHRAMAMDFTLNAAPESNRTTQAYCVPTSNWFGKTYVVTKRYYDDATGRYFFTEVLTYEQLSDGSMKLWSYKRY